MSLCRPSVPSIIDMSNQPEPASYEVRARSFGAIAEHYNRYRPAPPAEAVDWVLPQGCDAVLELGAGTGALTRQLVQRVRQVVSVEPDPAMCTVLSSQLPDVPVVEAVAEALPIIDTRFDAVVASSSWHWMDPELTPIEVARVLRPGGTLGLLWNGADRSIDWVQEILGPGQSSLATGKDAAVMRHKPEFSPGTPFHGLEPASFEWTIALSFDEMMGLMGSYSRVITLAEETRSRVLARAAELVHERLEVTGDPVVELPMRCVCWRAYRD
jgi:SAM-dependent methyltransferase